MAIPNAFRVLGVLGGVLALVAMHVVTGTTVRFLVRATEASGAALNAACCAVLRRRRPRRRAARHRPQQLRHHGRLPPDHLRRRARGKPRGSTGPPRLQLTGIGLGGLHAGPTTTPRASTRRRCPPRRRPPTRTTRTLRPAALLQPAFARQKGDRRRSRRRGPPSGRRGAGPSYLRALAVPDDGAIGWRESADTFISARWTGRRTENGGNPGPQPPFDAGGIRGSGTAPDRASIAYTWWCWCARRCADAEPEGAR